MPAGSAGDEKDLTLSRMGISSPSEPLALDDSDPTNCDPSNSDPSEALGEPVAVAAVQDDEDEVVGWTAAVDPGSGKTYYYNDKGESSWERPA